MASSMHTQVFEHFSILDEALLQPHKFIGLEMAIGSEIPGFGHDTRVSELTDENRDLFPTPRPVSRCAVGTSNRWRPSGPDTTQRVSLVPAS